MLLGIAHLLPIDCTAARGTHMPGAGAPGAALAGSVTWDLRSPGPGLELRVAWVAHGMGLAHVRGKGNQ